MTTTERLDKIEKDILTNKEKLHQDKILREQFLKYSEDKVKYLERTIDKEFNELLKSIEKLSKNDINQDNLSIELELIKFRTGFRKIAKEFKQEIYIRIGALEKTTQDDINRSIELLLGPINTKVLEITRSGTEQFQELSETVITLSKGLQTGSKQFKIIQNNINKNSLNIKELQDNQEIQKQLIENQQEAQEKSQKEYEKAKKESEQRSKDILVTRDEIKKIIEKEIKNITPIQETQKTQELNLSKIQEDIIKEVLNQSELKFITLGSIKEKEKIIFNMDQRILDLDKEITGFKINQDIISSEQNYLQNKVNINEMELHKVNLLEQENIRLNQENINLSMEVNVLDTRISLMEMDNLNQNQENNSLQDTQEIIKLMQEEIQEIKQENNFFRNKFKLHQEIEKWKNL